MARFAFSTGLFSVRFMLMVVLLLVVGFARPAVGSAQSTTDSWATRSSESARIAFAPELPALPELAPDVFLATYGPEIDAAIAELELVLDLPHEEIAVVVLPRLVNTDGIWFDSVSGQILIDGPSLTGQTEIEAINQVRSVIASALAWRVSDGYLSPLFVAGFARYAQRPLTPVISRYAANLQNANSQGQLLSWADLHRSASGEAASSEVAQASEYAVTAWLIDHYQLDRYRQFVTSMGTTHDWRAAIEQTYGVPAAELEREWRDDLPRWTNSGWKTNIIAGFDLDPARALLERGNYAASKASLERSQRLFSELGDQENLQVVTALLAQTEVGLQAEALMTQTEAALRQHDYERASDLIAQAEAQYSRMPPDQRPEAVLADYRARSDAGLEAIERLENATRLAGSWTEFPQARSDALAAGRAFAELGDATRLAAAETTLDAIDERVRRLVFLLGGLAFLSLVWLILWRRHGANLTMDWPEPIRSDAAPRRGT